MLPRMRRVPAFAWLLFAPLGAGCSTWFLSGRHWIDQSRPVALVETTGGVEYGATTEFGVLTLGRSASDGPCRVHYFLGPTPLIENGALEPAGGVFTNARIDLKTQLARALDRTPTPADELCVLWTPDGESVRRVTVELATGDGVGGDLLQDPGVELPAGAAVVCRGPDSRPLFAGLIAARATLSGAATGRYYVFAGVDRLRELLAVPRRYPLDLVPKYRTDDITVVRTIEPPERPPEADQPAAPSPLLPGLFPFPISPPKR